MCSAISSLADSAEGVTILTIEDTSPLAVATWSSGTSDSLLCALNKAWTPVATSEPTILVSVVVVFSRAIFAFLRWEKAIIIPLLGVFVQFCYLSHMKTKLIGRQLFVRIDRGEEVVASLAAACDEAKIEAGSVSGIGACDKAVIGFFDGEEKKYHPREILGDREITSIVGNVSRMDGSVYLHLHMMMADSEGQVVGGHLSEAQISATCEMIVDIAESAVDEDVKIGRVRDDKLGLNLWEL
jgi:uncharacterized protein